MATASKVHLAVGDTGILPARTQDAETAAKTSALLQENHDVGLICQEHRLSAET